MITLHKLGVVKAGVSAVTVDQKRWIDDWGDDGKRCWRIVIPTAPKRSVVCVQFARREDALRGAKALEELNLDWTLPHHVLRRQLEEMGGMEFIKRTIAEAMAW